MVSSSKNLYVIKDRVDVQAAADVPAVEEAQGVQVLVVLAQAEAQNVLAVADQADHVVLIPAGRGGHVVLAAAGQVQVRAVVPGY